MWVFQGVGHRKQETLADLAVVHVVDRLDQQPRRRFVCTRIASGPCRLQRVASFVGELNMLQEGRLADGRRHAEVLQRAGHVHLRAQCERILRAPRDDHIRRADPFSHDRDLRGAGLQYNLLAVDTRRDADDVAWHGRAQSRAEQGLFGGTPCETCDMAHYSASSRLLLTQ